MPTAPKWRADPGLPKAKGVALADAPSPADHVRFRKRVERAIERLMWLLDEMDGDADLEPSLGFLERHPLAGYGAGYTKSGSQLDLCDGSRDDREAEHDGAEPSLGAACWNGSLEPGEGVSQVGWANGSDADLEGDDSEMEENSASEDEPLFPWKNERLRHDGKIDKARADLDAIERRKREPASERDPDELTLIGDGVALWAGPAVLRAK